MYTELKNCFNPPETRLVLLLMFYMKTHSYTFCLMWVLYGVALSLPTFFMLF